MSASVAAASALLAIEEGPGPHRRFRRVDPPKIRLHDVRRAGGAASHAPDKIPRRKGEKGVVHHCLWDGGAQASMRAETRLIAQ